MKVRTLLGRARVVVTSIVFVAIVIVLMAWLIGVFHPKIEEGAAEPSTPGGRPVGDAPLVEVVLRSVPRTESAVGTIRAVHETSVASKLLARVVEAPIRAGAQVSRGDVLVRFDDHELAARLRQSEAAVEAAVARQENARILYDRVRRAFEQRAATQTEVDRTRTALDAAEADVQQAEQARSEATTVLGEATVRAPIDGVVIDKHVEVGDTAIPGQVLVTLYDPTRMQLVATVRESLTERLEVGQTVDVSVQALGKTCQGTVSEIVPEAQTASRAFTVKVTGPCPAGVYSGMFGRLLVPLDDEQVVLIPLSAVRRIGQLDVVDVADGGARRRRVIELGRTFDDEVEVLSGLRPGERIVGGGPGPGGS
jgi:RND family efflux transporter MFP subunit